MEDILLDDDLKNTIWIGEVLNVDDPNFDGRIKVNVRGKFDGIPVDDLPWAISDNLISSGSASGSGSYDVPKLNTIVGIRFENGDIMHPMYFKIQHVSDELKNDVISASDTPYTVKSLWYDSDINLKNYFNQADGINLYYKDSGINIKDDNTILLEYNNGLKLHIQEDMISLGQETKSAEPAVLGDKNSDALNELYDRIDELTQMIMKFAQLNSSVVGSISMLAPLGPAYTNLNLSATLTAAKLPNLPNATIPATLSKHVSLD